MIIKEIVNALENFAPLPLQEDYDNAGLQIGLTETEEVTGVLLCLDVTEPVIREAVEKNCNLIISHHPLIFRGVKHITGTTYVERCIAMAIRNGISIYSAHTNLDSAKNGVMYKMAEKIGLTDCEIINPRFAEGSGEGLIGNLPTPLSAEDFAGLLKRTFNVKALAHNAFGGTIRKVALCGGAGAFLIGDALRSGADAFVTGEIKYHDYFGYDDKMMLCALGHYESEQFTTEIFTSIIKEVDTKVPVFVTNVNTNPIIYL
ncbi:MAG: Nif3-like dinuclear metal center hexameric protein [Bacteroidaceae bacterium]|nr:Nif3-like dinuclear metal center hexameric protein [Bacteroidaceae bacterium]